MLFKYKLLLPILLLLLAIPSIKAQEVKSPNYRNATENDTTDINNATNHFGFTLFYSPLNTMLFGNEYREDNHQVSLFNFGFGLDYYPSNSDNYFSLSFGHQYYFVPHGGLTTDIDVITNTEQMNHSFTNLTYTKVFDKFYIGLGLGFSYTHFTRELEEEEYIYKNDPKKEPEYYYYYYYDLPSASLDLIVNLGAEIGKYIQVGFNSQIAMLFLRDQEKDFSHKASMGLTFKLKIH